MIDFDEALAIVSGAARPLSSEAVPLWRARGRHLARPVVAQLDAPRSDVSAMDGYAVRDGGAAAALTLIGAAYPGAPFAGSLGEGECVRIFTGAQTPHGTDRVIVQEVVSVSGSRVSLLGEPGERRHIRRRGSDFVRGDILLEVGRRLDARALVASAGADLGTAHVWRAPGVAVLGTGDELATPGEARSTPGAIPESVSFGVAALVEAYGGDCRMRERVGDDREAMLAAARRALAAADIVVVTGGASVGEKDHAKPVFARLGFELGFSKVAIKPGKPVWFARAEGKLVLGLPGNPTSALVTARLLLAPLIMGAAGGDPARAVEWRDAPSAQTLTSGGDRETFLLGRWSSDGVEPLPTQDSSAQSSLADADVLIRRSKHASSVDPGAMVPIILF